MKEMQYPCTRPACRNLVPKKGEERLIIPRLKYYHAWYSSPVVTSNDYCHACTASFRRWHYALKNKAY